MNGILLIDKQPDWTSNDVVAKLKGILRQRRIGHYGTLDPMATGLLVVFVGRATRAVEFAEGHDKRYIAGLRLGITTDTQDITGTVLEERPVTVTEQDILNVLPAFRGEILQIPPMYSALKVNGQKLYDLARKGKEVERQPRPITVHELELLHFDGQDARIRVRCSKGTYIRTLCEDMGEKLGCLGCMAALRRTRAGEYTVEKAVPLQTLLDAENPEQYLLSMDSPFLGYPAVTLSENQEKRCRNGNSFTRPLPYGTYRAYGKDGTFLMLAKVENNIMSTIKSFFEV